jgi:outer membrane murein-binding lipoprotein Lpp
MASAEYPNKAVRLAHEPTACKAPIESPSIAPDDTPTRLDEIEKRWQDQADINTDVQFLLAEVSRLREAGNEIAKELHAAINEPMYAGTRRDWIWRAQTAEAEVSRLQQENARLSDILERYSIED